MSVHSLENRVVYTSGQVFPFNFLVYEADHLRVTLTDANGVDDVLVLNIDYSVPASALETESGGSVTLLAGPLAVGERITIERIVPIVQELDLSYTGAFLPENIEEALDLIVMMIQGHDGEFARALLLGEGDIDGQGAYEAKGNRIEDLGNPSANRDAINLQTLEAWAQGAALGVPTIVPPIWEIVSNGGNQYNLPGATLSNKNTYTVSVDGVAQLRSSFIIDLSSSPPIIMFDTDIPSTMIIEVQCIGYARPIDPIPVYLAGDRPVADLSILGMRIRWRPTDYGNPGDLSPTLSQICDLNSAGSAEWVTLGLTT
jgi:hypothetical protein